MILTKTLLEIVRKKFPEQDERIKVLFETSEDFRALCSDYILCLESLQKFIRESVEKKHSIKEFSHIRLELETELSSFING
jgi:hypothetical protein